MENNIRRDPPFFVLDIGTRFVRGIVCERVQDLLREYIVVKHCEILEHEERAMFAGQIHDIDKAAKVVRAIKSRLEEKCGVPLTRAACAVAGRNLYTCRGKYTYTRPYAMEPISDTEVKQIELSAVQNALENTFSGDLSQDYCCVGYSPAEYRLDNESIKTLLGHRGKDVETDAIVTLLPYNILESMFGVLRRCDLEMSYLTLEPIAALEAVVPRDIYYLNLILIDIGAGTSDIAITSGGKVTAYGMVPHAGDEITEAISKQLLIDFNEAERLKREAGTRTAEPEAMLSFNDIFGRSHEKKVADVLTMIQPTVKELANHIAAEIRKLTDQNFRENYALILVGGGSLTPGLQEEVSRALELSTDRIGIRSGATYGSIVNETNRLKGPEAATCLGIAVLAARQQVLSLVHVTINEKQRTLLRVNEERLDVLSSLLSSGFNMRQVYGRPGLAKTFTLNGELKTIRGEIPVPAAVKVNNAVAALDTEIREGDYISVAPAVDGADARARIRDVIGTDKTVIFNGEEIPLPIRVFINGKEEDPETLITDRAEITTQDVNSLAHLLSHLGYDLNSFSERTLTISVNGAREERLLKNFQVTINGTTTSLFSEDQLVRPGDRIDFAAADAQLRVRDIVAEPHAGKNLRVRINGEEYVFPGGTGKVYVNGDKSAMDALVNNGDIISTQDGKDAEAVLVDIFRYLNVNPQDQIGRKLRLMINDSDAQFTSPLFEGAEVKVAFE